MKKIFCRLALCLSILTLGAVATSCDKETINQILNLIVGGESYTYEGTYTMQVYGLNEQTGNLAPLTEVATYEGTKVVAKAKNASVISATPTVDLTLPGTEIVSGCTMSEVGITNLVLNDTKLEVGQSTGATGTLTINGTQLPIYDITVDADITADNLNIKELVVYFGEEGNNAVLISFKDGKVVK